MDKVYAVIAAGSVEYAAESAEVDIDSLIEDLIACRDDGATHVLGLSGNYRGARYVRLSEPEIEWDDDFED